ncbi:ATP phosphoribosyltransferase regulatory subunit [Turneriella parva]|uniref:tRNA synthetase class II (G H P and S) n=1 Tax=Turneriella parva (strain ATCC BAA-1111 / DSM 21527 / NCTC 11395 / H) TaxID=869212 RepID=I4B6B7_TURPD|nr:ATP phosphoribosyltransferase regulatory subunit [Turneriella parva]AFM12824.1 tRNA synthetase class II (G H P and S) [Turneriella parva DSM 21527]
MSGSANTPQAQGSAVEAYRKVSSPYGFSMYDVEATAAIEKASRHAQDIVRAHGFERIMPAMVDFPETFSEGTHAQMFTMKDNSGERLALRNDITSQVIKGYVRQISEKSGQKLRRFYYAAPVYKDVRKNYPLPREIYQIGCEVVGEKASAELGRLIAISDEILKKVFSLQAVTQITEVSLYNAFFEALGAPLAEAVARRDAPYFGSLLAEKLGVTTASASSLALWLLYPQENEAAPAAVADLPEAIRRALQQSEGAAQAKVADAAKNKIRTFWQPLAEPRSSYYSGVFFETFVAGFTDPIARGGEYHELVKRYAPVEAEACGFALDLLAI